MLRRRGRHHRRGQPPGGRSGRPGNVGGGAAALEPTDAICGAGPGVDDGAPTSDEKIVDRRRRQHARNQDAERRAQIATLGRRQALGLERERRPEALDEPLAAETAIARVEESGDAPGRRLGWHREPRSGFLTLQPAKAGLEPFEIVVGWALISRLGSQRAHDRRCQLPERVAARRRSPDRLRIRALLERQVRRHRRRRRMRNSGKDRAHRDRWLSGPPARGRRVRAPASVRKAKAADDRRSRRDTAPQPHARAPCAARRPKVDGTRRLLQWGTHILTLP